MLLKKYNKTMIKVCKLCEKSKILTEFVKHTTYPDGYMNRCKACENESRNKKKAEKMKNLKVDLTKDKPCFKCNEIKNITQFGKCKSSNDGHRNKCKDCVNKEQIEKKNNRKVSEITEKTCISCKELKDITEFNTNRSYKDTFESDCRVCFNERKQIYLDIPEKREMFRNSCRNWESKPENKEKRKQARQLDESKEKMKGYQKKHRSTEKYKIQRNKIRRERYSTDPQYKILHNLRRRVNHFVKGEDKTDTTKNLLGCSLDELKNYLECQFKEGMSWDNYTIDGWHIDHCRPCVSFNLANKVEQRICFNWRNLQPLWAEENLKKSAKWEDFEWKEDIKNFKYSN